MEILAPTVRDAVLAPLAVAGLITSLAWFLSCLTRRADRRFTTRDLLAAMTGLAIILAVCVSLPWSKFFAVLPAVMESLR